MVCTVYSTSTQELEVKLHHVENQQASLAQDYAQFASTERSCWARLKWRVRKRVEFFSTSPSSWLFLIILGVIAGLFG